MAIWDVLCDIFERVFPPLNFMSNGTFMTKLYIGVCIVVALGLVLGIGLCIYRYHKKKTLLRSMCYGFILCVFIAALFLFFPLLCTYNDTPYPVVGNAFLLSVQSALKMFFGDFDFKTIFAELEKASENAIFSSGVIDYVKCLFSIVAVSAPILAIISLIDLIHSVSQHFRAEHLSPCKDIFVFNELTAASCTLAKSIYEDYTKRHKKPLLIFCDVFDEENEKSFNLLTEVRRLRGICYKDDLLVVDEKLRHYYKHRTKSPVSYFLIGEDETENVYQACRLAEYYDKQPVKKRKDRPVILYVSASKECNVCVLDSLTMVKGDNLQTEAAFKNFADSLYISDFAQLNDAYAAIHKNTDALYDCVEKSMPIIIKRIDPIKRLVWKTLLDKQNFLYTPGKKVLSVLITGVSQYGLEFLKTLCWFYQLPVDNFIIDIHVVDIREDLRDYLMGICPELIAYGEEGGDGEARFRITLHAGVNVFGGGMEQIVRDTDALHDPSAAFVCLGADDRNTEAAMKLRSMFKRYNPQNNAKVFAVVYDNVQNENLRQKLRSPDKHPVNNYCSYDITFIGAFDSLYNFKELRGYSCLIDDPDETVKPKRTCLFKRKSAVDEKRPIQSCDEQTAFFYHFVWALSDTYQALVNGKTPVKDSITPAMIADKFAEYCNFEYYRLSSLATCMHQYMLAMHLPSSPFDSTFVMRAPALVKDNSKDDTPTVRKFKKLEHARWNCYMRAEGFVYAENKNILAKTHYDLIHYDDLDPLEHLKD